MDIAKIEEYVRRKMSGEPTGHDWFHVDRVRKTALAISKSEKVDLLLVEMSALLHDIGDWKIHGKDSNEEKILRDACNDLKIDKEYEEKIVGIVTGLSFSSNLDEKKKLSLEGKIVQDADRLDALGAIGIARAFAYGGNKNKEIYNPSIKIRKFESSNSYKNSKSTTVNHFYEKLFLLKHQLNTKAAKKIAIRREEFMKDFLKEFYNEWEGKS